MRSRAGMPVRKAESEALYREILRRDSASSAAIVGLARILRASGRAGEALGHLENCVSLFPDSLPARD